jgi:hypothetical protein
VPLSRAEWYSREELHRFFSSGQNFNPLPVNPPYKDRLDALLAGYGADEAAQLVQDLYCLNRDVLDSTEREVLVNARIGQGRFRSDLVTAWGKGEKCALTEIAIPEMLIASHIKPWRESSNSERLDPMNGLLLAAHVDKLFDRFLLSFEISRLGFGCVLHPRIHRVVLGLGIKSGKLLNTSFLSPDAERRFAKYMSEHYNRHLDLVSRDRPAS